MVLSFLAQIAYIPNVIVPMTMGHARNPETCWMEVKETKQST